MMLQRINSKEIIKEYQSIYDNIRLVELKQNSRLPGKPKSLGMDYALADYIVFLDSDDTYEKDALEILYDTIQKKIRILSCLPIILI